MTRTFLVALAATMMMCFSSAASAQQYYGSPPVPDVPGVDPCRNPYGPESRWNSAGQQLVCPPQGAYQQRAPAYSQQRYPVSEPLCPGPNGEPIFDPGICAQLYGGQRRMMGPPRGAPMMVERRVREACVHPDTREPMDADFCYADGDTDDESGLETGLKWAGRAALVAGAVCLASTQC